MTLDDVARVSAWLVVILYAVALVVEVRRRSESTRIVIWCCGAIALALHVVWTMLYVHQGSLQRAYEHTARQSQAKVGLAIGWGVYANFLMLAIWVCDAAAFACWPAWRTIRPRFAIWIHLFFAFMFVNATVVFGEPSGQVLG